MNKCLDSVSLHRGYERHEKSEDAWSGTLAVPPNGCIATDVAPSSPVATRRDHGAAQRRRIVAARKRLGTLALIVAMLNDEPATA